MNRNLEIFTKIYKPYRIERKNNVYILETMDGNFAIKLNPKIDYKKLSLYNHETSVKYTPDLLIKDSNIRNGMRLILM